MTHCDTMSEDSGFRGLVALLPEYVPGSRPRNCIQAAAGPAASNC
jgi:hypothetical protein